MASRFYFSVEGQTEQRYFEWLENTVNTAGSGITPVRFKVRVEKDPLAFARAMSSRGPVSLWHVCDMESADAVHMAHFRDVLSRMERAEQQYPDIEYHLAYTNFTFELWLLLHRTDAFLPLQSRRDYLPLLNTAYEESFQSLHHFKRKKDFERILRKLTLADVKDAAARAREIERRNWQEHTPVSCGAYTFFENNPSLSLGECVEAVLLAAGA